MKHAILVERWVITDVMKSTKCHACFVNPADLFHIDVKGRKKLQYSAIVYTGPQLDRHFSMGN